MSESAWIPAWIHASSAGVLSRNLRLFAALCFIVFNLAVGGSAQADDPWSIRILHREHQCIEPSSLRRHADSALFAIVLSVIDLRHHGIPIQLGGESQREIVFSSGLVNVCCCRPRG